MPFAIVTFPTLVYGGMTYTFDANGNTSTSSGGRVSQTSTTTEYFLGDALGSVRQLTNTAGEVTYAKSYDLDGIMTLYPSQIIQ